MFLSGLGICQIVPPAGKSSALISETDAAKTTLKPKKLPSIKMRPNSNGQQGETPEMICALLSPLTLKFL